MGDAALLTATTARGWLAAQTPHFQRDVLKAGRLRLF
jgi:hypothetical protein